MSTLADSIPKLFEEIARAPQDAQRLVNAIIAKNGSGGVMKAVMNGAAAAVGAAAAGAHQKNVYLIMKFIYLQILNDCLAMIRMHPERMGVNDEVTRRFVAASEHGSTIAASLNQLFDSGGLGLQTEAQLILAQQVILLKSQLREAKAHQDRFLHSYTPKGLDQIINFYENQITAAILVKLIDQAQNDAIDFSVLIMLQLNRLQRAAGVRTIYEAGGRSIQVVTGYYHNFRKFINDSPSNRPFDTSFSMSFAN